MRVSKGLRVNAARLMPHLNGIKTPRLMPSLLKTLLVTPPFSSQLLDLLILFF